MRLYHDQKFKPKIQGKNFIPIKMLHGFFNTSFDPILILNIFSYKWVFDEMFHMYSINHKTLIVIILALRFA